ncbi:hypothetical protein VTO73DRAFT_6264 [Trametes versicolor]
MFDARAGPLPTRPPDIASHRGHRRARPRRPSRVRDETVRGELRFRAIPASRRHPPDTPTGRGPPASPAEPRYAPLHTTGHAPALLRAALDALRGRCGQAGAPDHTPRSRAEGDPGRLSDTTPHSRVPGRMRTARRSAIRAHENRDVSSVFMGGFAASTQSRASPSSSASGRRLRTSTGPRGHLRSSPVAFALAMPEGVETARSSSGPREMLETSLAPTEVRPWRTDTPPRSFNNAAMQYTDRPHGTYAAASACVQNGAMPKSAELDLAGAAHKVTPSGALRPRTLFSLTHTAQPTEMRLAARDRVRKRRNVSCACPRTSTTVSHGVRGRGDDLIFAISRGIGIRTLGTRFRRTHLLALISVAGATRHSGAHAVVERPPGSHLPLVLDDGRPVDALALRDAAQATRRPLGTRATRA